MVAVTILVIWIAAIDSLIPSTVLPAFVLGLSDNGTRRILLFASGVFTVSAAGGIALLSALDHTVIDRVARTLGRPPASPRTADLARVGRVEADSCSAADRTRAR